jgi:Ca-activated chloride channel family protein
VVQNVVKGEREAMAQTLTVPSGLTSREGAHVPLVGVSVEAEIRDYACRVVVSQRFRNDEDQPIEAVYRFPLDEGAAVCGFEAEVDGRRVVGRVEEREKAFEAYDDALSAGHGAYLLDEERPDVFTLSVGNLPPGKEAVLRLATVSTLALEGGAIRFTLPTTVAPRYAPAEDRKGVGETEIERLSPPYTLAVPYGLSLTVDVRTTAPVRSVESPSHPVEVTIDGGHATVRLAEREAALDRDVVLKIGLAETNEPRAFLEREKDGRTYALVSFRPRFEVRNAPAEVLFLLDRSGSMQGSSIEEARNALQLALRSLRPGCFFNVVGFGSTFEALFPESRPYDEATLAEAAAHVRSLDADLGGTEILPALRSVLEGPPAGGLPRQLFVLTDGEVSNTDAVIALAREHASRARVFTFGIGAGASHHLVKGLARAGEGACEMIAPGERVEAKVLRQLSRALSPALQDVHVDWGGLSVRQAPHRVPPVFAEGRVLVFARIERWKAATVTLRARGRERDLAFPIRLEEAPAEGGALVATLWARSAIRDLEEGGSSLHGGHGSRQRRALTLKDEQLKAEIVSLGTTWGLSSRHTSFVAVEERVTPTEGEPQLLKVPVAITRGWHGVGDLRGAAAPRYRLAARSAPPAMLMGPADPDAAGGFDVEMSTDAPGPAFDRVGPAALRASLPRGEARSARGRGGRRPLDRVVDLQRADGSWDLTDELAAVLGFEDAATLRKALERALVEQSGLGSAGTAALWRDGAERMAATALALEWLERECAALRGEWAMLAEKAREWLEGRPGGSAPWLAVGEKVLASRRRVRA